MSQVWSAEVRRLVDESVRCYNAGAIRASITATWTAVIADIIEKIIELADGGDADAATFRAAVDGARVHGITPAGVQAMQKIEDKLLGDAEQFELTDSIGSRELNRIREDRNLCVHPSLRHLGETYDPRPEVARAHLAVALSTVLVHPPTQGRKALEDFTAYVSSPYFAASEGHIQSTFFDRLRTATRGNVLKVAAKHALCEVPPPAGTPVTPQVLADRMAETIKAFARRDRDLVRRTLQGVYPRFQVLGTEIQLRAIVRLGDQDFLWDMIEPTLAAHLDASFAAVTLPAEYEPLSAETAALLALVRDSTTRSRLPSLERRYAGLGRRHRIDVAGARPDPYFLPSVVEQMTGVESWRGAEQVCELMVLPHAPILTVDALQAVLEAWWSSHDCRTAVRMPSLAVELFTATAHLGTARYPIWKQFLQEVRQRVEAGDSPTYRYNGIEQALSQNDQ